MAKVAILGGGVAGLTAAHELVSAAAGAEVHVYEASSTFGGKARSQFLPGTGVDGRADLPGEHGFRFFPAWYTHLPDTMARIPTAGGARVLDSLVASSQFGIADVDDTTVIPLPRSAPSSAGDMFHIIDSLRELLLASRVSLVDTATFGVSMLRYLLTCEERRLAEYEGVSFFDFVRGSRFSSKFQHYLNSSRFMVAMDSRKGSARTIGDKVIQLLLDFRRPQGENDRVLNGPTTTQWLDPWVSHLAARGVFFHPNARLSGLDVDGHRITGARFGDQAAPVTADHFILAVPIEIARRLVTDTLAGASPELAALKASQGMTDWMVGAQFFLSEDVRMCDGHVAYPDSDWALSSISQASFWKRGHAAVGPVENRFGDGRVRGILSVDISDWSAVSAALGKPANACVSADEVLDEVWRQLRAGANTPERQLLRDELVVGRHLDTSIGFGHGGATNSSPLLVHPPGSWRSRPTAAPAGIDNLFLAGDYVQTTTDLASMEGASEAARMAVNALLDRAGTGGGRARVFPLGEEAGPLVKLAKDLDRRRFQRGDTFAMLAGQRRGERATYTMDEALELERGVERTLRDVGS